MGSAWDAYDNQSFNREDELRAELARKQREIDALKYEHEVETMADQGYIPRITLEKALTGIREWLCGKCGCTVVETEIHNKVCPGRKV